MPHEWSTSTLEDAGVVLLDCEHKTPPAAEAGYPYIAIPDIRDGRIDISGARRIREEDYIEWTRKTKPQAGDVVVTRRGRVGDSAIIPEGCECAIGQNLVLLRATGDVVSQQFLRWLVRSPAYWGQVRKFLNVGAVFESLNCRDIPRFELPIPPRRQQEQIASMLDTLDSKIELNRKMNRTLEEIAQTLFRAWFVDFEGETELVESELGPIPRGWRVEPIGDLVETLGGGTPSTKEPEYWEDGEIHWTTPRDLSGLESPVLLDTARRITEAGLEKISSALLPEGTVLLSSRAPVGYTAIAQIPIAVNQGYIAIPPGGRLSSFYVLFWLRENLDRIKGRAGGTTFQEISKKNFRPMLAIEPPKEAQQLFDDVVAPLFQRIVQNERQSRTLADLRDTLLPKLISGEIRVPEAEEALEEAV